MLKNKFEDSISLAMRKTILIVFPLIYCLLVLIFSKNIPVGDDYWLLDFLNKFFLTDQPEEKLELLIAPHNEHRLILTKVLSVFLIKVFGDIDFRYLIFLSNIAFLLGVFHLIRLLSLGAFATPALLIALVMVNPQAHKLMFYPMAAIQAYFGFFFSISYIDAVVRDRGCSKSIFFYFLAVISSVSGVFLSLVGLVFYAYRRRWWLLLVNFVLLVAVVKIYTAGIVNTGPEKIDYFFSNPHIPIIFFVSLLGVIIQIPQLVFIAGLFLIAGFAWQAQRDFKSGYQSLAPWKVSLYLLAFYVFLQVGLIAIGRSSLYGDDLSHAALDGRYRIYGLVFASLVVVNFFSTDMHPHKFFLKQKKWIFSFLIFLGMVLFLIGFFVVKHKTEKRMEGLRLFAVSSDASRLEVFAHDRQAASEILSTSIRHHIFKPDVRVAQ